MMFKKKREEERVSGQKGENKSNRIRTADALSHALVLIFVLILVLMTSDSSALADSLIVLVVLSTKLIKNKDISVLTIIATK